jgi:hypothetical protein
MHRTILLLLPSFASTISGSILVLLILGTSAWSYAQQKQLFYEGLFGVYGFKTLMMQAPDGLSAILNTLLRGSYTYFVLVVVAAVIVGLSVYAILQGMGAAVSTTSSELNQMRDHTHRGVASEAFKRLMIRILGICGWGIYIAIFLSSIIPMSIVILQSGLDSLPAFRPSSVFYFVGAVLLLGLSLHVHVIFARLCTLRIRVLGGDEEIDERSLSTPRI